MAAKGLEARPQETATPASWPSPSPATCHLMLPWPLSSGHRLSKKMLRGGDPAKQIPRPQPLTMAMKRPMKRKYVRWSGLMEEAGLICRQ